MSVSSTCIWFGVSRKRQGKNPFGLDSHVESVTKLAKGFTAFAIGQKAGQLVDLKTVEDAEEVGKEYD